MILDDKGLSIDPARVRALARDLVLTGPVTVEDLANRLGTSTRTLQRHLACQGISLRGLVLESRMDAACVLLRKTELDVQEIAGRVGYSTPSSFARAFARWTGSSPRTYRKAAERGGNQG
ncbi:helix-turn-helix domain-containing protein [Chachezhania sediminis]|uniref:helix-turn-helix domain-containing protein n=1 Tax=Chachezhania sediminis TaxID=2599291 RepID=UPI00131E308A|nr:AraC family transcriptional regulator [Chachezhania sediminis]